MIHGLPPAQGLLHRRFSLIEALDNSIVQEDLHAPSPAAGIDIFAQSFNDNKIINHRNSMPSMQNTTGVERIYSVRQILNQQSDNAAGTGRHTVKLPRYLPRSRADDHVYQVVRGDEDFLPAHPALRSRTQKRSKSQPMLPSPQDSDEDFFDPSPGVVSRMARVDSAGDSRGSSQHASCRSSMQSTSSSSTSNGGDHNMLMAEACWDHVALLADELPFAAGDYIRVLDASSHPGLWYGSCRDAVGWFPASHVRVLTKQPSRQTSSSLNSESFPASMRSLRAKIIQELMNTERDYVALLENIVNGFVEQTRRRGELFPVHRVRAIFGNIEQICTLHTRLLRDLEMCLDTRSPENTCVGSAFLRNKQSFGIYSDYCNNRPVSCAELQALTSQPIFHQFFEACRLLRGMPNLSLEGFLLTPVQRICRYPLQLGELLKATPIGHDDREALAAAERAMRGVASHINDRKRRIEALQKVALWQKSVHGWRGPDLLENNSAMLKSGEVNCRCMLGGQLQWTKDVQLFLFDQSIVICKKDLLKKNFYMFKERMSLQSVSLVDVTDGKEPIFGVSVKHAFKLVGSGRQYLFCCSDKKSKAAWLESFNLRTTPFPAATAEEKRLAISTLSAFK